MPELGVFQPFTTSHCPGQHGLSERLQAFVSVPFRRGIFAFAAEIAIHGRAADMLPNVWFDTCR